ncbi:Polarized growth protein rax2 [Smittium culicis]|uniref:Polarized growth protein rax2 n=1 Tax=Smittium culicis TaxID=133412 RepID=A0A1R1YRU5_9FUNG|nr:Polarized growth protein rax2 [Smittium culicis]
MISDYAGISRTNSFLPINTLSHKVSRITNFDVFFTGIETKADEKISSGCILNDGKKELLFLGGKFSSLKNNTKVNNVAAINKSGEIDDLNGGIVGEISSIYCDNVQNLVYFSGSFFNSSSTQNIPLNNQKFNNIAVFNPNTTAWNYLSQSGVDGPINSIQVSTDKSSLFLGGDFNNTIEDSSLIIPQNLFLDLSSAIISTTNSSSNVNLSSPNNIICNSSLSNTNFPWISDYNTTSSIEIDLQSKANISSILIKNYISPGRGTKSFTLFSLDGPTSTPIKLSFFDSNSNTEIECTESCPLPLSSSPQLFTFQDKIEYQALSLNITEWYGDSAALSQLGLFRSNPVVYPSGILNYSNCFDGTSSPNQVSLNGNWNTHTLPGDSKAFIESQLIQSTGSNNSTSDTYATLTPITMVSGYFDVFFDFPGCNLLNDCDFRTSIVSNVISPLYSSDVKFETIINQKVQDDASILIYSGFIQKTTQDSATKFSFSFYNITVNSNITPGLFKMALGRIRLIPKGSMGNLNGVLKLNLKYQLNNTLADVPPYSSLYFDSVGDTKVTSLASYENGVFIGGSFNNQFSNIAFYNGSSFLPLPNSGLSGKVNSLLVADDSLYVGGEFNGTSDFAVQGSLLKLSLPFEESKQSSQFSPVDLNFSGNVNFLSYSDKYMNIKSPTLIAMGSNLTIPGLSGNKGLRNIGIFSIVSKSWNTSPIIKGTPSLAFASDDGIIISGAISQISSLDISNVSVLTLNSTNSFKDAGNFEILLPLTDGLDSILPYENGEFSINTSAINKDKSLLVAGGLFKVSDGSKNVAKFDQANDTWVGHEINNAIEFGSPLPGKDFGRVNNLILTDNYLIIGGVQSFADFNPSNSSETTTQNSGLPQKSLFNGFTIWDNNSNTIRYNLDIIINNSQGNSTVDTSNSTLPQINSIAINPAFSSVFVSGVFEQLEKTLCKNLCKFDLTSKSWTQVLDNNIDGDISSLSWFQNTLFISGNFANKGSNFNSTVLKVSEDKKNSFKLIQDNSFNKIPGNVSYMSQIDGSSLYLVGSNNSNSQKFFIASYNGTSLLINDFDDVKINSVSGLTVIPDLNSQNNTFIPLVYGDFIASSRSCSCVAFIEGRWSPIFDVSGTGNSSSPVSYILNLGSTTIFLKIYSSKAAIIAIAVSSVILAILVSLTIFISRRRMTRRKKINVNKGKKSYVSFNQTSKSFSKNGYSLSSNTEYSQSTSLLLGKTFGETSGTINGQPDTYFGFKPSNFGKGLFLTPDDSQEHFSFKFVSDQLSTSDKTSDSASQAPKMQEYTQIEYESDGHFMFDKKLQPVINPSYIPLKSMDVTEKEKKNISKIPSVNEQYLKLDNSLVNLVDFFNQNPILNSETNNSLKSAYDKNSLSNDNSIAPNANNKVLNVNNIVPNGKKYSVKEKSSDNNIKFFSNSNTNVNTKSNINIELHKNSAITNELYKDSTITNELYKVPTITNELYKDSAITNKLYKDFAITNELYKVPTITNELYKDSAITNKLYKDFAITNELTLKEDKYDTYTTYDQYNKYKVPNFGHNTQNSQENQNYNHQPMYHPDNKIPGYEFTPSISSPKTNSIQYEEPYQTAGYDVSDSNRSGKFSISESITSFKRVSKYGFSSPLENNVGYQLDVDPEINDYNIYNSDYSPVETYSPSTLSPSQENVYSFYDFNLQQENEYISPKCTNNASSSSFNKEKNLLSPRQHPLTNDYKTPSVSNYSSELLTTHQDPISTPKDFSELSLSQSNIIIPSPISNNYSTPAINPNENYLSDNSYKNSVISVNASLYLSDVSIATEKLTFGPGNKSISSVNLDNNPRKLALQNSLIIKNIRVPSSDNKLAPIAEENSMSKSETPGSLAPAPTTTYLNPLAMYLGKLTQQIKDSYSIASNTRPPLNNSQTPSIISENNLQRNSNILNRINSGISTSSNLDMALMRSSRFSQNLNPLQKSQNFIISTVSNLPVRQNLSYYSQGRDSISSEEYSLSENRNSIISIEMRNSHIRNSIYDSIKIKKFSGVMPLEIDRELLNFSRSKSIILTGKESDIPRAISYLSSKQAENYLLSGDVETDNEVHQLISKRNSIRIVESFTNLNPSIKKEDLKKYPKYVAKYNFDPMEETELGLKIGDIIYILNENDGIWWAGAIDRGPDLPLEKGVFPATYVHKVNN